MNDSVQQHCVPEPPWYRRHVADCLRGVLRLIPGKKFTSSTDAYVAQYCKLNGLIHHNQRSSTDAKARDTSSS